MSIRLEDLPQWAQKQALAKMRTDRRSDCGDIRIKPGGNKYHNEKVERDNLKFDSKKEAKRYDELMIRLAAGQIRGLQLQRDFTLQEAYTDVYGKRVRAIRYRADFVYERKTNPDITGTAYWITVVEDVKSRATKTKEYSIKRKLMKDKYNIDIQEV